MNKPFSILMSKIFRLICCAGILLLSLAAPTTISAIPEYTNTAYFLEPTLLEALSISADTGEIPQSKVWENAGSWWAVLSSSTASSPGTWLWKLVDTTWTEALKLSDETGTHADVKSNGSLVHVLLYDGTPELVTLEYVGNVYQLWSVHPGSLSISLPGSETATIDLDSTGRMWLATENDSTNTIVAYSSSSPYTTWEGPVTLASGVHDDDIAVVTALPGKIGVLWSNQNTKRFGFRTHTDGADLSTWAADEVPASQSALNVGLGMADQYLNVAVADGTLYAAVETSYDTPGYPTIALLIRRSSGVWDDLHTVDVTGSRPIVLLESHPTSAITVVYTSTEASGDILYRRSPLVPILFSPAQTLLQGVLNNVTSTKDTYGRSILLIASTANEAQSVRMANPFATELADIAIAISADKTLYNPDFPLTYTITVSNNGTDYLSGIKVIDTFPASLTGITWTCTKQYGASCTASGSGDLNQTVTLPVGGVVTYTVTGTIASGTTGELKNTAYILLPDTALDYDYANNATTLITPSAIADPTADLAITKTDNQTAVTPGSSLTYTITATNNGPSTVVDATLSDLFPAVLTGVTWTCTASAGASCTATGTSSLTDIVDLPSGASVTYTVQAALSEDATGSVTNTASISPPAGVIDPDLLNNTATDTDSIQSVPPPHPSSFYGEIRYAANPPGAGDTLSASLPEVTAPITTTITEADGVLRYTLDVPGDIALTPAKEGGIAGDTISFSVAGRTVATALWQGGTNTVLNIHPPHAALTAVAVNEGSPATLDASTSVDIGADISTYSFNCDTNPGYEIGPQAESTTQCTFPDSGSYSIGVLVTDQQGGQSSTTTNFAVQNVAPSAIFSAPNVDEGEQILLSLTNPSDPSSIDTAAGFSYAFNCGLGYGDWSSTASTSCPTTDAGTRDVKGKLRDKDNGEREYTQLVTITNLPPTASAGGPYTAASGQELTLTGSITCPLIDTCTYGWDLDGDTDFTDALILSPTHVGYVLGENTVRLRVTDSDGASAISTAIITTTPAFYSLTLVPGWNLVSFTLHPTSPLVADVLTSLNDDYDLVYAWDAALQDWLKYDPIPESLDNLIALDEKQGFWVHILGSENRTLTVTGSAVAQSPISLLDEGEGWNLVGYPALAGTGLPAALGADVTAGVFERVYAYHASEPVAPWKIYDLLAPTWANNLPNLTPGWGYWIKITTPHDWEVAYR